MVDPMKGLWFIIFIIVLQQVDGNIICPLIVGDSLGISGIWVLAGVTLGGGLGGVAGMVLGVPILAVLYLLLSEFVNKRLQKKGTVVAAEEYSFGAGEENSLRRTGSAFRKSR